MNGNLFEDLKNHFQDYFGEENIIQEGTAQIIQIGRSRGTRLYIRSKTREARFSSWGVRPGPIEYLRRDGKNWFIVLLDDVYDRGYLLPSGYVEAHITEPSLWSKARRDGEYKIHPVPRELDSELRFEDLEELIYKVNGLSGIVNKVNRYAPEKIEEEIEESKTLIKLRQGQSVFRAKVLANFGWRCCLSGIGELDLLVASHIIPWAERKDTRLDLRNGLCLFLTYDKLFDQGYFSFDNHFEVIITRDPHGLSEGLQAVLQEIEGMYMAEPLLPIEKEFLKIHREKAIKKWK